MSTADTLVSMGYILDVDFIAHEDRIDWLSTQPMPTQAEIDAAELNVESWRITRLRNAAKALISADDPVSKEVKAFVLVVLDEFNRHADQMNAMRLAVTQGTSLGNVQTRMTNVGAYPQRTADDLKTAMSNKIDAGQADG